MSIALWLDDEKRVPSAIEARCDAIGNEGNASEIPSGQPHGCPEHLAQVQVSE
jgi:hypothetical protein